MHKSCALYQSNRTIMHCTLKPAATELMVPADINMDSLLLWFLNPFRCESTVTTHIITCEMVHLHTLSNPKDLIKCYNGSECIIKKILCLNKNVQIAFYLQLKLQQCGHCGSKISLVTSCWHGKLISCWYTKCCIRLRKNIQQFSWGGVSCSYCIRVDVIKK